MSETPLSLPDKLAARLKRKLALERSLETERQAAHQVARLANVDKTQDPVIFFNASTRISGLSYNAAYQQLAAWGLRLQGVPVIHFVCNHGMGRCVQGTDRDDPEVRPPCRTCLAQSKAIYQEADVAWLDYRPDPDLSGQLKRLGLDDLLAFSYRGMPLGQIVAPSLRWVLRRYHLEDDQPTRFLCAQYILAAWNIAGQFKTLIDKRHPRAVVVFNGTFFPEAAAGWAARQKGIRVVTHETGFLAFTGFFTFGNATAYPLDPGEEFQLDAAQEARLDEYLAQRFKGNFSMAGIRFWPEIKRLDGALKDKIGRFKQMVPVFTNVIFDTSQEHANAIFPDMFSWLDQLVEIIRKHPEALFILRAHPDEGRKGKASREPVAAWVKAARIEAEPNVVFINPDDFVSSYELVEQSKFVLVYNSSIGLEASILGKAVLCAGKVRYHTQGCQTVTLPGSIPDYFTQLEMWLSADQIQPDKVLSSNARRFLFYQVFVASLPFDRFLQADGVPGFVSLARFPWSDLDPDHSATMNTLVKGILDGNPFLLE